MTTARDNAIKSAQTRIQRILLDLDETLIVSSERIDSVTVDLRMWGNMTVEIWTEDRAKRQRIAGMDVVARLGR